MTTGTIDLVVVCKCNCHVITCQAAVGSDLCCKDCSTVTTVVAVSHTGTTSDGISHFVFVGAAGSVVSTVFDVM